MLEGMVFLVVGLLGLVDTLRPERLVQAKAYGDLMGILLYTGLLSAGMMIGGGILCLRNRTEVGKLKLLTNREAHFISVRQLAKNYLANKAAVAFLMLGLYVFIMPYLGYIVTTFLFFLGIFGWQGYRISVRNLLLSLITTAIFAFFAHVADIPVPRGILYW